MAFLFPSSARLLTHICVLFSLLFINLVCSCESRTEGEIALEENILLVGNGSEPETFDPQKATGVTESKIITALFEGLIADHPSEDNTMVAGVASSWEANEDFTQWTFHLRPEARWSDGNPLTSADFLFAYERILNPETAAPYASMLYDFVAGAEAYNHGETDDFSSVGIATPDAHTLVITCKEPVPFLPSLTRHYTWFPVPAHCVTKFADPNELLHPWSLADNIVGNGPFQMKEHRFQAWVEVEKNPHYWDKNQVSLDGIRFYPIKKVDTELRTFLAGNLHVTYTVPPNAIELLKEQHSEEFRQETYVGTRFLRFNTTREGLGNPLVREALSLTIDRQALVENIYVGSLFATSFVPPMGDYRSPEIVEFDPERARELLAEAGYPEGKNFPKLKILISGDDGKPGAEAIQRMWSDELQIDIDIEQLDWGSYLGAMRELNYDIVASGWIGDYLDPTTFLNMWQEGNGNNRTGWANEEYETLLELAAQEADQQQRYQYLQQAEQLFVSEHPIAIISWYTSNYMLSSAVENWHALLLRNQPWKEIRLKNTSAETE